MLSTLYTCILSVFQNSKVCLDLYKFVDFMTVPILARTPDTVKHFVTRLTDELCTRYFLIRFDSCLLCPQGHNIVIIPIELAAAIITDIILTTLISIEAALMVELSLLTRL